MAEYTSTQAGFQRFMLESMVGPLSPQEYVDATVTPDFYHINNGKRLNREEYVQLNADWRGKISDYKPVV
jgi:hypothetical protein